jgi:hydrogenase nickel incorporation protein HypA/HybF
MHELAIAEAVIDIAAVHAAGRRVTAVYVKVGRLRQVVPAALEFSFALAAEGTPVQGARLEIEHVPAGGVCRACGRESELDAFPLSCAACGGLDVEVIRGEELLVDSLECDEEMAVSR